MLSCGGFYVKWIFTQIIDRLLIAVHTPTLVLIIISKSKRPIEVPLVTKVLPRAYKRREGMQLGKHQNSHVGGRMCMNAHVIDFECRQKCS